MPRTMFTVDLTNATKYPDIDEFFGFTTASLIYMYIACTVPDIIAIVGNIIVLYTSLRYKSFNLCKITVTFLENLAAADLMGIVVALLPMDLVIFTKTWILGKAVCAINGYFTAIFGVAEIYILVSISCYRLALLRNPFSFAGLSRWKVLVWMVGLWTLACIPTMYGILSSSTVYYDPYMLSCTSTSYNDGGYIMFIFTIIFLGIPMLVIIICNTKILIIAIQQKRRLRQERALHKANINALITVGCVCWMFIISWIPYTVRILAQGQSVILPKWFYIFQTHVLRLNVVMNPIIYTCTNRSFKTCVKERILGKIFKSFRKPAGKQSSRFESTKRVQISST